MNRLEWISGQVDESFIVRLKVYHVLTNLPTIVLAEKSSWMACTCNG